MGERLNRLWPSLVALIGTVAVVFGLLYFFGDRVTEDDPLAGTTNGADDSSPGATSTATGQPTDNPTDSPTEPTDGTSPSEPVTAPPELLQSIGVLNSTSIAGLAASAEQRFEAGGWNVEATGNYSPTVSESVIYYPTEDMRASAEAFSVQFPEVGLVEPTPAGSNLNTSHPVVILAEDYSEDTESGE